MRLYECSLTYTEMKAEGLPLGFKRILSLDPVCTLDKSVFKGIRTEMLQMNIF